MRSRVTLLSLAVASFSTLAGCGERSGRAPEVTGPSGPFAYMEVLAADSMEGRRTGTAGSALAARFIEGRFRAAGLAAAGDSGFYQLMPMSLTAGRSGRVRP
ncbi:MAG: hypothetical protein HKP01_07310, partial [Gemmatimonadetes bacterium]|nr:hypothetical protein [Gemmatimonadota bacterium]